MFKGSKQGGGGSQFVTLTGLFNTKKGTGMIGSISPDAFATVVSMMEECDEKGVDLVFFVGENTQGRGKAAAYLSVTVGKPREEREENRTWGNRTSGSGQTQSSQASFGKDRSAKPAFGSGLKPGGKNPPPDPLEKYLEDPDKN